MPGKEVSFICKYVLTQKNDSNCIFGHTLHNTQGTCWVGRRETRHLYILIKLPWHRWGFAQLIQTAHPLGQCFTKLHIQWKAVYVYSCHYNKWGVVHMCTLDRSAAIIRSKSQQSIVKLQYLFDICNQVGQGQAKF